MAEYFYDEETIQRAWDHLKMIDEGLLERKGGVLSSKVHHLFIEIKKELKKMKKAQGDGNGCCLKTTEVGYDDAAPSSGSL
ncbi:hypothetical protein IC803_00355 [Geobacillus sp. 46C-IIa]|uniref:hypothetical protein n=1 Tax=Geobacillus sp. 46C-IIa TaxID=1963025 RepID=UPI00117A566C|nr:hypothetical protein [Geobacillus sp. 46C-IIa]QNU28085.1 hypothetical protein IC803_00355 [Geobacillus sp. 46C-IIa]